MKPRVLDVIWLLLITLFAIFSNPNQSLATSSSINKASSTALSIPDTGASVNSAISVSGAPTNAKITGMDIHFSANHPRSSDLDIKLSSTLGGVNGVYHLWSNEGGTAPNPSKTVTGVSTFNGLSPNGTWNLVLRDTVNGSAGSLVEWWVTIYYNSENGTGYTTYSTDSTILDPQTNGTDQDGDGYMETFQFLIRNDYKAPDGFRVRPKLISNATGQAWAVSSSDLSNAWDLISLDESYFALSKNTDLTFTVDLYDYATSKTILATNQVKGGPIKAGVYHFVYGTPNNWTPGVDANGDGFYDTYNFQIGAYGETSGGPFNVIAKVICTTTGQTWWASAPWSITGYTSDWHYFNFSQADFTGRINGNTALNFTVELWDATKTTKLATAPAFDTSMIKVAGNSCSVAINSITASNTLIDPYTGGNTNFTADIAATPSANWRLNINGEDVAVGNTLLFSQAWYGKNLLGQILEPGTYTATLTATDPTGQCTDSKPVTFNITKKADSPTSCMMRAETGSTTNVATGDVDHSQTLFSLKGTSLSTSVELFYNSLNPYNGPLGPGWSHTYDITVTENPDGSVLLREGGGKSFYSKSGSNFISPSGDFSTLVKNVDGTYVITYRDGHAYNFSANGKIASIVDRFSNSVSFVYQNGDLYTVKDPAQRVTTFNYDTTVTPHRISKITDPNQKIFDFSYQGTNCSNELCKVTNPDADPVNHTRGYWEYQYDAQGFLKSKKDPQSNLTQYNYDTDHRLQNAIDPEGIVDPIGHTRTLAYPTNTGNLRTTTLTEKDGGTWLYTYDAQAGVIKTKTDPNSNEINYYYYPNGFLKAKTEPKDGTVWLTTFYSYDNFGNLLIETEPADLSTYTPPIAPETVTNPMTLAGMSPPIKAARHYAYVTVNNIDKISSIADERGATTLATGFVYSTENNGEVVTATTTPGNYVTVTKKNPNGTVSQIIDANLKSTTFTYFPDSAGNRTAGIVGLLQATTDTAGVTITVTSYDVNGNPTGVKVTDKNGVDIQVNTTMVYDALSRLTSATKKSGKTTPAFPDIITTYGYDLGRNLTSLTDAETHTTSYQYNYNSQVTKSTDAKLKDTVFTYSGSGCASCGAGVDKLTGVYDANVTQNTPLANQPHTGYQYDLLGRLEYETDPLGKKMYYTYYDNGQLWQKYDATESTPGTLLATYLYNNRGQITDRTFADGTYEHFTYTANGQLETATNQDISYTYLYYDDGRLHTVTDTTNNRVISYDQFDNLGQRQQVTIMKGAGADQRGITYDYDSANRPWHITSNAGVFRYDYDNLGRRWTLAYPNQVTATYLYDDLNRLTSLTNQAVNGSVITNATYTDFDKVGNRKDKGGTISETYFYDELYRLLTVTSGKSEGFTFDPVGNRQSGPGATDTTYQYNSANQMTQGRRLSYGYDNRGNQTTKTVPDATDKTWTRTWDYSNRLIEESKVKGTETRTITYKYDPLGRRIEKKFVQTVDGVPETQTTTYVYDNEDVVLEIFKTDSGTEKTFFTHGPGTDEPLALERGGQYYYYHADGLGSISAITDASKSVIQSYGYTSYGMATSSSDFRNSYQFAGREYDWETGTYYYRNRILDPMDGTFTSKDPISFKGGINLYSYVGNNPINQVDPSGLAGCTYSIANHQLVCSSNNGSQTVTLGPEGVFSGDGQCTNNTSNACINNKDEGPIQPGIYQMNPDSRSGHELYWRLEQIDPKSSGLDYVLGARGGFMLHPGGMSLGCITTNKKNQAAMQQYFILDNLLRGEIGKNVLYVVK
jgi:RHS repeat-associated protein